jgi:hypothetical protein
MTRPIRFLDFVEALLIGYHWNTGIGVLSCYYDDSGTHEDSDVVVWAGLFGNKYQWAALDDAWAQALKYTPPNCRPLTHFHMVRCDNGSGEFGEGEGYQRWPRPEREKLAKELRRIINANMLNGFGIGVDKKAWEAITGNRRRILGDAEGWAIRQAIAYGTHWAQTTQYERRPDLAMFFDRRRMGEIAAVHKMIDDAHNLNLAKSFLRSITGRCSPNALPLGFSVMEKTHPIQAADIFAWEFYQVVRDVVINKAPFLPSREQMKDLIKGANGRILGAIVEEQEVQNIYDGVGTDEEFAKRVNQLPKTWNWKVK